MIKKEATIEEFKEMLKKSRESKKNGEVKTRWMTRLEKIKYEVQTSLMVV